MGGVVRVCIRSGLVLHAVIASLAASGQGLAPLSSGDAYLSQSRKGDGSVSWTLGTSRIELRLVLEGGCLGVASLLNRSVSPPQQYAQAVPAAVFRGMVGGELLSGMEQGWRLESEQATRLDQGELQLSIAVRRGDVQLLCSYILYPGAGIVRARTTLSNAGTEPIEVVDPPILSLRAAYAAGMGSPQFGWFTGADLEADAQRLCLDPVQPAYQREFSSSYGALGHLPLMLLCDSGGNHGLFWGWDYLGPWAAHASANKEGVFACDLALSGYRRELPPGDDMALPSAFMGVFSGDLDDMGNDILDWQYGYYWQHKASEYFARPRLAVDWPWALDRTAAAWVSQGGTEENWAYWLSLNLYFTDLARYTGAAVLWNDASWYDEFGSWRGPDFGQVTRYLDKHGMKMMVWMPTYNRYPGSLADEALGPPTIASAQEMDQSRPEATDWQRSVLDEKVREWGNFQWRWDCAPGTGTDPLAADEQFRQLVRGFLDDHPECAVDGCSGGGLSWIGVELAGYACSGELTDGQGVRDAAGYYTTLFVPPDLLHWVILAHHQGRKHYAIASDRAHLRVNPSWYADPGSGMPYQNRGPNPAYRPDKVMRVRDESLPDLERLRHDWDLYRYLVSKGVAGRWAHVFRPKVEGDDPLLYLQRMDRGGSCGVIVTNRPWAAPEQMPEGAVTVFPKGLQADLDYDVGFESAKRVWRQAGSDLMRDGILLPALSPGEIIYLGLPDRPGAGTDRRAPSRPRNVTKRMATNVNWQGVEVVWEPARDDRWISGYRVFRVGPEGERDLGKVSQGTYCFDRELPAGRLIACRYEVSAVDGDGNESPRRAARLVAGEKEAYHGFSGYGVEQGFRGWYYEAGSTGVWRPLKWESSHGYEGRWTTEDYAGIVARTYMRAHPIDELARTFVAPHAGDVVITGRIREDLPPGTIPSDECRVRILLNDRLVWPAAGWTPIPATRSWVTYECHLSVDAGDRIAHVTGPNRHFAASGIAWYPEITYED